MNASPLRRALLLLAGLVAGAVVATPLLQPQPAEAADLSTFNPGYIISDTIFYDSSTMSAPAIQSFLNAKAPNCVPGADGTPCLKNFRQTTWTRPADTRCVRTYEGAADETAAQIIAKVAQACGINPRVILVMLQKEQSLVTASGSTLYANRYRSAMGYGCPDTAPCDAQYYGFFNQVYSAAWRFHDYRLNPTRFSHRAGMTNNIRYHPNTACGSSPVYIQNQATAGLYNYTPYQPNAAALAAGYGTGDACSAYGNRNFFNFFSDWFGNPTGVPPTGFLDAVTTTSTSITAAGWALDPDTSAPIQVHMYVDGASAGFTADQPRPDLEPIFGKGPNHGFTATMPATVGPHTVCVYAINSDGGSSNRLLGCRDVHVPSLPTGFIDSVTSDATSITASGWAMDPDTTAPIPVTMSVDGVTQTFTADQPRPDIDAVFRNGPNHGFTVTMPASVGPHRVCLEAVKPPPGSNRQLGCRTVTVVNHTPTGFLDSVTTTPTTITATGWALDPDTHAPIAVHMYVDGSSQPFTADQPRPDIGAIFGKGDLHGYTATMNATPGPHTVCVYALNATPGDNRQLGCRTVTVVNNAPTGFLDSVTTTPTSITATGWALDPDTHAPIAVHLYVDGSSQPFTADLPRPDIGAIFGKGDLHGYSATVEVSPGPHTVCVWALNATPGPNRQLGCRTVTVANQVPTGFLDSVTTTPTTITATGWALDPDTDAPIAVHMYVDGSSQPFTADLPRPDIGAIFGKGDLHGFSATMNATPGPHTVCVWALNDIPGGNRQLGCRAVTVP